ncbi:hypothetical protein WN943_028105 [Citrus x changshan-huyou]
MDLSYNNLSSKIPSGTQLQSFDASMYAGNELCDLWLPNRCLDEDSALDPGKDDANASEDKDQFITLGFYVRNYSANPSLNDSLITTFYICQPENTVKIRQWGSGVDPLMLKGAENLVEALVDFANLFT